MKHFAKIADGIDVVPLLGELSARPDLWDAQTMRKRIGDSAPHAQMSDIWVRYNEISRVGPHFNDEHVPVWYPAWKALPSLHPILFGLMTLTEGEMLGGVLITRIPPGMGIGPHLDHGWHVEQYDKFYLSLQSEPGAMFWCDADNEREALEPRPGEVWLFDNRKLHWVENRSAADRITLIVCIRTEKYGRV